MLGVADAELLFAAVDAIAAGDPGEALRAAARLSRVRARPGPVLRRPRGARARAADRPDARRRARASCASRPSATSACWPRPSAWTATPPSGCSTCSPPACEAMKDGADARTQLELALVKAAAPERRPVHARRCWRGWSGSRRAARRPPRDRPSRLRCRRRQASVRARPRRPVAEAARGRRPPAAARAPPSAVGRAAGAATLGSSPSSCGRRVDGDVRERERPAGRRAGAGPPDPGSATGLVDRVPRVGRVLQAQGREGRAPRRG